MHPEQTRLFQNPPPHKLSLLRGRYAICSARFSGAPLLSSAKSLTEITSVIKIRHVCTETLTGDLFRIFLWTPDGVKTI